MCCMLFMAVSPQAINRIELVHGHASSFVHRSSLVYALLIMMHHIRMNVPVRD